MANVELQPKPSKETIKYFLPTILAIGIFACTGESAAGSARFNVTPHTNLRNGQTVIVSGSGFAKKSPGAIAECSTAPSQPTIEIDGNQVPVSCTDPLKKFETTTETGKLGTVAFTVHTGRVGPPIYGIDSIGHSAMVDARAYPCPPTPAQIKAGVTCEIRYGNAAGNEVSQNIYFEAR
jgi:hypothetical protein